VINSSEHIALVCGAGKAGVVESAVGNSQNSDANASKLQDLHVLADDFIPSKYILYRTSSMFVFSCVVDDQQWIVPSEYRDSPPSPQPSCLWSSQGR
jgi:hypothetical protein